MERLVEMMKMRKICLCVAFIDMEKAYDKVDRNKKNGVVRAYT